MALSKEEKATIIKEFGGSEANTGKTEVQIALLTAEIRSATKHLENNQKDFSNKRSLYRKVSQRHSLLSYLKRVDIERYRDIVKKLNLRN